MAYESTSIFGSGIQVFRETQPLPSMRGTNSIVLNPEDIAAGLGIIAVTGGAIGTSSANLLSPPLQGRREVHIQNSGPNDLFIGGDSSVSVGDGFKVASSGSIVLPMLAFGTVWGISDGTANVRVLQLK